MNYKTITHAIFLERPNRFIARVLMENKTVETVHVKNTGRCRELLKPGATVILEKAGHAKRKTAYSLVAVYKGKMLVNIDSQVPNGVVYEALQQSLLSEFGELNLLTREVRFGASRFDLYYETRSGKGFIEVKGVTLEQDGIALFPDAPTKRGVKHLKELAAAVRAGYEGAILFLLQMKGPRRFKSNQVMDAEFAAALRSAKDAGVRVLAYDSRVTEQSINLGKKVTVW